MNTDPDCTFPSFLSISVFSFEYQTTMDSVIFIHSGYQPLGSDDFSGFTELTKRGGAKCFPRLGGTCFQMKPAQPLKLEDDDEEKVSF